MRRIRKIPKNMYWRIIGRSIHNPSLPPAPGSFLFVCMGNICRSPFAAGMAEKLFRKEEDIRYGSAGTHVRIQMPSPEEAVAAARQFGVNLGDHLSREIDFDMLDSHDMILVMEAGQFGYLKKKFPRFRNKIFLLPLFEVGLGSGAEQAHIFNIDDPYDKPLDAFLNCYKRITLCLEGLFGQIRE